jgi:hypothetical protein
MGGLVIKQAYLPATRDSIYQQLGRRIHSMFFLGTTHRGADSVQLLSRLLSTVQAGKKVFVNELQPGSGTLKTINDEFRHECGSLKLWSFFEGAPMNTGLASAILVDKDSAVIGLPGEHVQHLDADHRQMCKFEHPEHPNYLILQRCLLSAVEGIEKGYLAHRHEEIKSQMSTISTLLDVHHRPEPSFSLSRASSSSVLARG